MTALMRVLSVPRPDVTATILGAAGVAALIVAWRTHARCWA